MTHGTRPVFTEILHVATLGRFEVRSGARRLSLGGLKQNAVLARLLVGAGTYTTFDELIEAVWGEGAPPSAASTLHGYLSRLRRVLGRGVVRRSAAGYRLDPELVDVDYPAFEQQVTLALGQPSGPDRVAVLEAALARWADGPVFGPLGHHEFVRPVAARLEELRICAVEAMADTRLAAGAPTTVIPALRSLAVAHPLRESLTLRLVQALYLGGRPAEALLAYDSCRQALAEELGVDPCRELRDLHAAVLSERPVESAPQPDVASAWWLPPRSRLFVGRAGLRERARALLAGRPGPSGRQVPQVLALFGLGGVGKTELALELAYQQRESGGMAWWLDASDQGTIAAGLDDLTAALALPVDLERPEGRSLLWDELEQRAGWVLVFDNAGNPETVAPFLPPAGRGQVIVTSRQRGWRRLATPLPVPPFERSEATGFLLRRTGSGPDAAAPAGEVARLLGDLPIALERACAYIDETGIDLGGYHALLRSSPEELIRLHRRRGSPLVPDCWRAAVRQVEREHGRAAEMLEVASFLAAEPVPLTLFRTGTAAQPEAVVEVDTAVAELLRLSLVDREQDELLVHPLVQASVREGIGPDDWWHCISVGAELLRAAVGDDPLERGEDWSRFAPHVLSLRGHADALVAAGHECGPLHDNSTFAELLIDYAERCAEGGDRAGAECLARSAARVVGADRPVALLCAGIAED